MANSNPLFSPEVDALAVGLEEAARATEKTAARFVEPAEGTLSRALANRNHLLFGRRGSGKTSLLLKARTDLVIQRRPNAFVDLERFKGLSYPDVLVSILIEAFGNLQDWLGEGALVPASKVSFWRRVFGRPSKGPLKRSEADEIASALGNYVNHLTELLHAQDGAEVETLVRRAQGVEEESEVSGTVKSPLVTAGGAHGVRESDERVDEVKERLKRSKVDFLHRQVGQYQRVLADTVRLADADGFLLLDDLYHIPRASQADVLDYFHRLTKGTGLWLKVGTIRFRSTWYRHGDPSIGMKLGDDAEEIDLDVTLEKYQTAKRFLFRILQQLASEYGVSLGDLLTDGARDRLVLASGGVARDFLSILRRALSIARERGESRIGAESVNQAAGEHESAKRDEFRRDVVLEEEDQLEHEFSRIKRFCLEERKVNCFVVEKDLGTAEFQRVKELVDLRLLHNIASRVTVRNRPGRLYEGYMVDISQYTGERKRRELDLLAFWKPDGRQQLRKANLIYAEN